MMHATYPTCAALGQSHCALPSALDALRATSAALGALAVIDRSTLAPAAAAALAIAEKHVRTAVTALRPLASGSAPLQPLEELLAQIRAQSRPDQPAERAQ